MAITLIHLFLHIIEPFLKDIDNRLSIFEQLNGDEFQPTSLSSIKRVDEIGMFSDENDLDVLPAIGSQF